MAQPSLDSFVGKTSQPSLDSFSGKGTTVGISPSESIWGQISSQFQSGIKQGAQGVNEIGAGESPIKGAESGLRVESGVATALTSPLAPIMKPISDAIGTGIDKVTNIPTVQRAAMKAPNLPYMGLSEDFSNLANVTGTIASLKAPTSIKDAVTSTPEEQATQKSSQIVQAVDQAKQVKAGQIDKLATEWSKPAQTNMAGFNKVRDIVANSPDTPKFLGQLGLDPRALVEDGKYNTTETAQQLRDTAGKLSADTLKPSLDAASFGAPKTPVSEIVQKSVADLQNSKGVTSGNVEAQIKQVQAEGAALERKYPDGMTLSQMHDEKITYAQNGGYSPIGDPNVNNSASVNRSLGRVLAAQVEDKAPSELPVKDFNKYLSQYYKAADYLDSLNTKKAPVTLGQQIMRGVAKFGGASIGGHLGGGIVSEFAGYQIGKALEHALENLSGKSRAMFLHNIQDTNPEAMGAVKDYLQKVTSGGTGTPLLNPASSIIPPAPSIESQMASRAASLQKGESSPTNLSQPQANPPSSAIKKSAIPTTLPETAPTATPSQAKPSFLSSLKDSMKNGQRGFIKNPYAKATELHPEDRQLLTNYIDSVRTMGKSLSERDHTAVESIFTKLGISLDQPLAKLATQAELILNGQKDASALYKTGRNFKK